MFFDLYLMYYSVSVTYITDMDDERDVEVSSTFYSTVRDDLDKLVSDMSPTTPPVFTTHEGTLDD